MVLSSLKPLSAEAKRKRVGGGERKGGKRSGHKKKIKESGWRRKQMWVIEWLRKENEREREL